MTSIRLGHLAGPSPIDATDSGASPLGEPSGGRSFEDHLRAQSDQPRDDARFAEEPPGGGDRSDDKDAPAVTDSSTPADRAEENSPPAQTDRNDANVDDGAAAGPSDEDAAPAEDTKNKKQSGDEQSAAAEATGRAHDTAKSGGAVGIVADDATKEVVIDIAADSKEKTPQVASSGEDASTGVPGQAEAIADLVPSDGDAVTQTADPEPPAAEKPVEPATPDLPDTQSRVQGHEKTRNVPEEASPRSPVPAEADNAVTGVSVASEAGRDEPLSRNREPRATKDVSKEPAGRSPTTMTTPVTPAIEQSDGMASPAATDRPRTEPTASEKGDRPSPPDASATTGTPRNDGSAPASARLPMHLAAGGGRRTDGRAQITEADQVRLVQRVARAFRAAGGRGGRIRLRLSPPELGSLHLEVKVRAGEMTARIVAETHAARSILLDNLGALRHRLAEQNIKVEQFDVDLADGRPGGTPQQPTDQESSHDRRLPPWRDTSGNRDPSVAVDAVAGGLEPGGDGKLNVVI